MESVKRKYNQNIIDFVVQHYGDPDRVIDFLRLNETQWDDFYLEEDTSWKVPDETNNAKEYYLNKEIDVVSGLDTTDYTGTGDFNNDFNFDFSISVSPLFKPVTYYSGTTEIPDIVVEEDPNTLYKEDFLESTGGFTADETYTILSYGDSNLILNPNLETSSPYVIAIAEDVFSEDLSIATYKVTIDTYFEPSGGGEDECLFALGGYTASDGSNSKKIKSGKSEFEVSILEKDFDNLENSMLLWFPSDTATSYVDYLEIEKIT